MKLCLLALMSLWLLSACVHREVPQGEGDKALSWETISKEQNARSTALGTALGKMSVEFEGRTTQ